MRRSVECPKCRATAEKGRGKPYCPSCGWNRESAEKHLRREIRVGYAILGLICMEALVASLFYGSGVFFVALLVAGMLSYFGGIDKVWNLRALKQSEITAGHANLVGLGTIVLALLVFVGARLFFVALLLAQMLVCVGGIIVWKLRALNQLQTTFPDSNHPLPRGPFSSPTRFPEKYEFLRSLPPPRKVRSGWLGFLEMTKWRLLVYGEIAFGRIIAQNNRIQPVSTGPGGGFLASTSEITYDFRDSSGSLIEGTATDGADSFFEEMIIPVFYEKANPRNNTVLTNLDDIVKPGD